MAVAVEAACEMLDEYCHRSYKEDQGVTPPTRTPALHPLAGPAF